MEMTSGPNVLILNPSFNLELPRELNLERLMSLEFVQSMQLDLANLVQKVTT